jgi:hypothetical protein
MPGKPDKDSEQRAQLHYALGTYAEYLLGTVTEAELEAAVAAVPADQMPDYTEITAQLRDRTPGRG